MKLALDLTHCSHSSAQTGIQQVARGLWKSLPRQTPVSSIVFDKYADYWRPVDPREASHLATIDGVMKVKRKRPHWSTWQRIRGRFHKRFGIRRQGDLGSCTAALVPEFFAEWVGPRLPELKQLVGGPVVAVFHDCIAFHRPEWGVPATVERYPQYLRELAGLDGIACVSEFSRKELLLALEKVGAAPPEQIRVVPLGLRTDHLGPPTSAARPDTSRPPTLLCVATIEPRKNHPALLAAAERLWNRGFEFRLVLAGMVNRGSGRPIEAEIKRLQSMNRPIEWRGSMSAGDLADLYRSVDATVFPSVCEGFGLPVLESLYFGKPCLSANGGALKEVAPGGGTLIANPDADGMTAIMEEYLSSNNCRERLKAEAEARQIRTMDDYAADLLAFIKELDPGQPS
jgi:glycosyltransferase involved in cell wall biosynthesis